MFIIIKTKSGFYVRIPNYKSQLNEMKQKIFPSENIPQYL